MTRKKQIVELYNKKNQKSTIYQNYKNSILDHTLFCGFNDNRNIEEVSKRFFLKYNKYPFYCKKIIEDEIYKIINDDFIILQEFIINNRLDTSYLKHKKLPILLYVSSYEKDLKDKNDILKLYKNIKFEIVLLYSNNKKCNKYINDLNIIIDNLQRDFLNKNKPKNNIGIIVSTQNGIEVKKYEIDAIDDISLNYNDNIIKERLEIINSLKSNSNGIYFLHGLAGTGKTTLIKSLSQEVKEKDFIFIPSSMSEALSSPNLIPLLIDNKNSVLVIEDAENSLKSRDDSNRETVSNLLNISDGILSDFLKIQIICTFNTDLNNIDPALLRKGRAKSLIEFDKLTVDKSNNLLKHISSDYITSEPMLLADIYNVESKSLNKENKTIGFLK